MLPQKRREVLSFGYVYRTGNLYSLGGARPDALRDRKLHFVFGCVIYRKEGLPLSIRTVLIEKGEALTDGVSIAHQMDHSIESRRRRVNTSKGLGERKRPLLIPSVHRHLLKWINKRCFLLLVAALLPFVHRGEK
ncbi:hypothetical protein VNO80_15165 [Phaseolus coccineus]|uniref:Uncharacterized protein n=1 Tax=Phaseolus coccineus TaxID=3886 RepID=A0AAN9ML65_PHACN